MATITKTADKVIKDANGQDVRVDAETGTRLEFKDVGIQRGGAEITVPPGMSLAEARVWLKRREDQDNQQVSILEMIDAFPLEGAYALAKALARIYGFTSLVTVPGSFFSGPRPPMMVGIQVSPTQTEQVPWGRIEIPALEGGYLETSIAEKDDRLVFQITGQVLQKFKDNVREIADLTRKIIETESIYRGKAIRVKFPESEEDYDPRECPKFIDTSAVRENELVFSADVARAITTSLFTPIENTANCRKYQIPLKRGVLLEGPFGCGKSLTANVTAKKCEDNGWTFIYLSSVSELETAIHFARSYQPAVIFAEDIDRVMDGDRDEEMDKILNTIDGVDTKDMELIVVLTTNHVENIEPAMMRPGRLDAVISVKAPDAAASIALVRLYARGRLDETSDLTGVGKRLDGQIPAVIREVVERSKLAAVARLKDGEELLLRGEDLEFAAGEMLNHLALMTPKPADERSDVEKAADALGKYIGGGLAKTATNGKSTRDVTAAA